MSSVLTAVRQRLRRRARVAVVAALVLSAAAVWQTTAGSFVVTTANDANTFGAGSISISDNSGGSALFTATSIAPGGTATVCVGVRYVGSLAPTGIKLYTSGAQESDHGGTYVTWANDATSEMDDNLFMQIQVNNADLTTDPGSGCAPAGVGTFTDVAAAAPGTLMRTMIGTNSSFATGLPSQWGTVTTNKWRVFKFIYTFPSGAPLSAQGDGLKVTFNWEAQR